MSEETLSAPAKKRCRPGFATKMALLDVIERKRVSYRVDYRSIGLRHGVSGGSLRVLYGYWKKGEVDLGEPQTPQERAIDARVQMETSLVLFRRYKALLMKEFEGALFKAEDATTKKEANSWKDVGLPDLRAEVSRVNDLILKTERGYVTIVDEYRAQEDAQRKNILSIPRQTIDVDGRVVNANEEQIALAALA